MISQPDDVARARTLLARAESGQFRLGDDADVDDQAVGSNSNHE